MYSAGTVCEHLMWKYNHVALLFVFFQLQSAQVSLTEKVVQMLEVGVNRI